MVRSIKAHAEPGKSIFSHHSKTADSIFSHNPKSMSVTTKRSKAKTKSSALLVSPWGRPSSLTGGQPGYSDPFDLPKKRWPPGVFSKTSFELKAMTAADSGTTAAASTAADSGTNTVASTAADSGTNTVVNNI